MNIKDVIKNKSNKLLNITSENITKVFDYPAIKSRALKDGIKNKIRERAILSTKARLAEHHKTFDDYTDEELEIIIIDEEKKIKDDLKTKTLVAALAILGLDFLI
jgi:Cdc6-like AAA superfamily ATPase